MKNKYSATIITVIAFIMIFFIGTKFFYKDDSDRQIKVGFVYIGDAGTPYTNNFIRAQIELEEKLGDKVQTIAKYNIGEKECEPAVFELVKQNCDIIFMTSYAYNKTARRIAAKYPEVQFCLATGDNANKQPVLPNYHNFMGLIYEGSYTSGVVGGLKLQELIRQGKITRNKAKIGYIASFPYAEAISSYTAFFLGVRSIVPEATMTVRYTKTWSNHVLEKKYTELMIYEDECVLISQHTDTAGPAIACEEAMVKRGKTVFHVGYNQSMSDVAPTTSLVSYRINWSPYIIAACRAVLKNKRIESVAATHIPGNDAGAGFRQGWIEMIGLNQLIASENTQEEVSKVIKQFKSGDITVFTGNYIGENPRDKTSVWDLKKPYPENSERSAPSFCYVLRDVIEVK